MKTASFENTVDILVKAYLNDTLQHTNCCACVVGNIVAAGCGYTYYRDQFGAVIYNEVPYPAAADGWFAVVTSSKLSPLGEIQVKSTGYTPDELREIEYVFEDYDSDDEDDITFSGLMRVVDVLAEIHNVDLSVKESAKLLFVKP